MSDEDGASALKQRLRSIGGVWRAVPGPVRKLLVAIIGATLVLLGIALVVLPGPFTLPLLLAGFFVLASEFAWAGAVLSRTRQEMQRAGQMVKRVVRRKHNN